MMKTEKELKDALEDIFFDALTDKSNPPYYTDKVDPENDGYWQWKVYELCADELIKRGYGDVSEYKAEIERLKAETSNIRKDTAKEILQTLYDKCYEINDETGEGMGNFVSDDDILCLAKHYGVEVDV